MLEELFIAYAVILGLSTGAFIGWAIYRVIKKKREDKLMNFDDEDQRFIDRRY